MKFPDSLKIGGHIYKVEFPHAFEEEDQTGVCDYMQGVIRVSDVYKHRKRAEQRIKSTLLHEVFHAIDHIYNSRMINNSKKSEKTIDSLECYWFQILADNDLYLEDDFKYPKKVRIGGYDYKVEYPYEFTEFQDKFFKLFVEELRILISDKDEHGNFNPSLCKEAFIDGIMRIIDGAYELGLDNRSSCSLSEGLYQVLVDNKLCSFFRGK